MKVLQVLPPMSGYRGIITYVRTLDEFIDSLIFSPETQYMTGMKNTCNNNKYALIEDYDVIHFHDIFYPTIARMAKNIIFTCHTKRVAPLIEGFSETERIKHTIAISPEVSEELDKHNIKNTYIPQPIAHYNFIPQTPAAEKLRTIVIFNNDCSPGFIERCQAERRRGTKIIIENRNNVYDTRNLIDRGDLIVSVGRGALEAASMLKPVFIVGTETADGHLGDQSYDELKYNNFSGRCRKLNDWSSVVKDMYDNYNIKSKDLIRKKVIENNDPKTIAKQIKDIYEHTCTK